MPDALSTAELPRVVRVRGTDIRYDVRGSGERALVLVHGHKAHHGWWRGLVEVLAGSWRMVLLDLSGHGDSGRRPAYGAELWASEIIAVAGTAGVLQPVLVGHSMGGRLALLAAARYPERLRGVIMIDSVIGRGRRAITWDPERSHRLRGSRAEAIAGFRLRPSQPVPTGALLSFVADYAVTEYSRGWGWKHDPRGLPAVDEELVQEAISGLTVPLGFIRAERSALVTPAMEELVAGLDLPRGVTTASIAGVHHHLLLEDPRACAEAIERIADGMRVLTPPARDTRPMR